LLAFPTLCVNNITTSTWNTAEENHSECDTSPTAANKVEAKAPGEGTTAGREGVGSFTGGVTRSYRPQPAAAKNLCQNEITALQNHDAS